MYTSINYQNLQLIIITAKTRPKLFFVISVLVLNCPLLTTTVKPWQNEETCCQKLNTCCEHVLSQCFPELQHGKHCFSAERCFGDGDNVPTWQYWELTLRKHVCAANVSGNTFPCFVRATVYRPYPWRLVHRYLSITRHHCKGKIFSSVSFRPWVFVRSGALPLDLQRGSPFLYQLSKPVDGRRFLYRLTTTILFNPTLFLHDFTVGQTLIINTFYNGHRHHNRYRGRNCDHHHHHHRCRASLSSSSSLSLSPSKIKIKRLLRNLLLWKVFKLALKNSRKDTYKPPNGKASSSTFI